MLTESPLAQRASELLPTGCTRVQFAISNFCSRLNSGNLNSGDNEKTFCARFSIKFANRARRDSSARRTDGDSDRSQLPSTAGALHRLLRRN